MLRRTSLFVLTIACADIAIAGCASTADNDAAVESAPGTVAETAPAVTETITDDTIGRLTIILRSQSAGPVSKSSVDETTDAIRVQLRSIPNDFSTEASDRSIRLVVEQVAARDQDSIVELARPLSRVTLRGVVQCVAQPGSDDVAESSTGETLPVVQPDMLFTRPGPDRELCQVGPVAGTAAVFSDATSQIINGSWGVTANLRPDESGEGVWNALAESCYNATEDCLARRLAIVLDGEIATAPTVNAPVFTGSVQISGVFTKTEADDIADIINEGAADPLFVIDSVTFTPT